VFIPLSLKPKGKVFYGWYIISALFFINLIIIGNRFSFGVFFKSLASEFDLSRATTSSLVSLYWFLCSVITVAGGWTLDKFGPRLVFLFMGLFTGLSLILTSQTTSLWQLYLTYSLLLAVGTAPWYPVIMVTVSRWFDKKRGFIMGIADVGARLGQSVWAPFCAFLISNYGWRWGYIISGLISIVIIAPLTRVLRNSPKDVGALPDGAESITLEEEIIKKEKIPITGFTVSQALRTRRYWFLSLAYLLVGFGILVMTHIIPYATDKNVSAIEAATIVTVIGGFALTAAVIGGRISDIKGRKTPIVILLLLRAAALVSLLWVNELWMFYIFAAVFGVTLGGFSIIMASFCIDIFGQRSIGVIMSSMNTSLSLGSAIGPYIGGLMYDLNNSYQNAFLIAAIFSVIAAFLACLVKPNEGVLR
jgi:MFS family permease